MADLTKGLNDRQAAAVETLSGPLLILAGAGSGKTKTLTHRIANLISHGVKPSEILAVTFTNKSAKEMKERVVKLVGENTFFPYLGTFHSICVRILRIEHQAAGLDKNFIIYDTDDQQTLVKRLMKQLEYDPKTLKPKMVISIISKNKSEGVDPEKYSSTAYYPQQKQIANLYHAYEKAKNSSGAVDFDDLLLLVDRLFAESPEILDRWQDKIKHVLVDEYQDTNHTQYSIIKALSKKHHNICVVGDDWQSIYSWRGADYTNILNFESDFPGAKVIKLEQNYRSTGNILKISQKIISQNSTRTEKTLFTEAENGSKIEIYQAYDEKDEANYVARKIFELLPTNFSNIAILYRTNAQSYAFEKAFISARIPYKLVGGMRFYDRKEIKDALAILRLIVNPADRVSLERVIKNVTSGIGEASFQKILFALDSHAAPNLSAKAAKSFARLNDFVTKDRKNQPVAEIISELIEYFDFAKILSSDTTTEEERLKNLEVLIGNAADYDTLDDFLADAALMSSADDATNAKNLNVVTLSTMHAAKGLEFPIVFLVGMEEGVFPSPQAENEGSIEEERRLAYVGMTRAMQDLKMTFARSRFGFGGRNYHEPSRFLLEVGYIPTAPAVSYLDPDAPMSETCDISDPAVTASDDEYFFDEFPPDDLPFFD